MKHIRSYLQVRENPHFCVESDITRSYRTIENTLKIKWPWELIIFIIQAEYLDRDSPVPFMKSCRALNWENDGYTYGYQRNQPEWHTWTAEHIIWSWYNVKQMIWISLSKGAISQRVGTSYLNLSATMCGPMLDIKLRSSKCNRKKQRYVQNSNMFTGVHQVR